ncbi:hypothetical protein HPB50_005662 [Hyalomma asiaticum]|uniref:Uncharacterized protein n=1 Tax=Hyalomma asiaticum TaxID=266040 RepID=A0ACB7RZ90_HYAAI|nr:hypothetical protein HPB50_005662 [Hyalomma asiaticum]
MEQLACPVVGKTEPERRVADGEVRGRRGGGSDAASPGRKREKRRTAAGTAALRAWPPLGGEEEAKCDVWNGERGSCWCALLDDAEGIGERRWKSAGRRRRGNGGGILMGRIAGCDVRAFASGVRVLRRGLRLRACGDGGGSLRERFPSARRVGLAQSVDIVSERRSAEQALPADLIIRTGMRRAAGDGARHVLPEAAVAADSGEARPVYVSS